MVMQAGLVYPKHQFKPEDTLTFVHMRPFERAWDELGLSMVELHELEVAIMAAPTGAPVMPGTRGLRKMRFSPKRWHTGKRGGMRACYVYLEEHHQVLLALVYPKTQKDDLTAQDKKRINRVIESIERELDR